MMKNYDAVRQNEGKSEIESDQESEMRKKSEMNLLGWYSLAQMRAWCIRNGALVWLTCRILLLNLVPTPRAHTLGSPLPVRTPLGPPHSICAHLASYSLCTHMYTLLPVYTHGILRLVHAHVHPTPSAHTCTPHSLCTRMYSPLPVYTPGILLPVHTYALPNPCVHTFSPHFLWFPSTPFYIYFLSSLFCFCYLFILAYSPSLPTPCV